MERVCQCIIDNKKEYAFIIIVALFLSVLFYQDYAMDNNTKISTRNKNRSYSSKNQSNAVNGMFFNQSRQNKKMYRSPRATGAWRNATVSLFGMPYEDWTDASQGIIVAHEQCIQESSEKMS